MYVWHLDNTKKYHNTRCKYFIRLWRGHWKYPYCAAAVWWTASYLKSYIKKRYYILLIHDGLGPTCQKMTGLFSALFCFCYTKILRNLPSNCFLLHRKKSMYIWLTRCTIFTIFLQNDSGKLRESLDLWHENHINDMLCYLYIRLWRKTKSKIHEIIVKKTFHHGWKCKICTCQIREKKL